MAATIKPTDVDESSGSFGGGLFTPEPRTGAHFDFGLGAFDLDKGLAGLEGRKNLLIYMHDNPDPDAMAAAMGLKQLIESATAISATLALGGIVGRAENRAMVEKLHIPLIPAEVLNTDHFDAIAVVDSQPGTGNNSLPPERAVDIVIDHHPAREESARAPWCDIRPQLGATSTMVLQYLRERRVALPTSLATALFYALRSETRDLGREATAAERDAYLFLIPMVDHHLMFRIQQPKLPRQYYEAIDRALRMAETWGDVITVNLGVIAYPDLVAEVADLLLDYESAQFVLCCGRYSRQIFVSMRTEPSQRRAGELMRQLIGNAGASGGHGTTAGGRLFAQVTTDADQQNAFDHLVYRLLELTGRVGTSRVPLIDLTG
ncbi:MAG: DHH family phosphoesterase [Polyangia bacterium]|jgi:nanoRNase/pAp phosphatase (c-di-AMP/oligoRNAs hydrolase)